MPERPQEHHEYTAARELMELMVATSQRPKEGNEAFVDTLAAYLETGSLDLERVVDPEYPDRSLLVVHVGDPEAEQVLTTISHGDVVGVEGQESWETDPWKLYEDGENWIGRGVCDTHGSGVSMLLAALRPEIQQRLHETKSRVSIVFTYDEEATTPEFSMRGARHAVGEFGTEPVVTSKYYIAGEPTEIDGAPSVMRGHKGRWLAHFIVDVDRAGHVSDDVLNAFEEGSIKVEELKLWKYLLTLGSAEDEEAAIFNPPYTTAQVSAARVKQGDYSTTPSHAEFTVDMRTLPFVHDWRTLEARDLFTKGPAGRPWPEGVHTRLVVEKDAAGSMTRPDSPIVLLSETISGQVARGFNGGDEGRIMRAAGLEGVTIGPGKLAHAHMPNETIAIQSVLHMANVYGEFFMRASELPRGGGNA